jgi:serine/threonine protein kinase
MCKVFRVGNCAVKCPHVTPILDSELDGALMDEIAVSRPLAHMPSIVRVYDGVRLPLHGLSIVMEYVDDPALAMAVDDRTTIYELTYIRQFVV